MVIEAEARRKRQAAVSILAGPRYTNDMTQAKPTTRSQAAAIRTGAEYLRSLDDGRKVFLDGEAVGDVSQHKAFAEAARSVARLYDIAAAPENRDLMTFASPKTGAPVLRAYQIPKTHAELRERRLFHEKWAEATFGLMGRSPDHVAGFFAGYAAKNYKKGIIQAASGAFGNAATRMASFVVKDGAFSYGNYPDIDALYPQQADELDQKKRAAILDKMQQLVHEKAIYAPIWQLGFLNGVGPRVGESGFDRIPGFAYTAPFEDLTIKA